MSDSRTVLRLLTALTVALALMCLWMAVMWKRAQDEVRCWRDFVAHDERPPEGDCRRL